MVPIPDPEAARDGLYYERLELGPAASHEDIVRSYRRLALGAHPDAHPGDPEASRRFREITEAYEVLADRARREVYDRTRRRGHIPVRVISVSAPGSGLRQPMAEQRSPEEEIPLTFLGSPRVQPLGSIPLHVGPVHVDAGPEDLLRASSTAPNSPRSALADLLFDLLDSWWRR
jgi:curved DNA-binding protein CbpA